MNQNNKIPATVRILTLQGSKLLRRALESVKDFDEILVFDGNSTDDSVKIAKEYGARIEKTYPDRSDPNVLIGDWSEVVNRVVRAAKYDWVFYIDQDESASSGLIEEIREIVSSPKIDHYIYNVPNQVIYEGRIIKHSISYGGYQPRLFNRKSEAHYEDTPHYTLVYNKEKYPPGMTKNPWYVYTDHEDMKKLKKNFIILTAIKDKDQNWWQFIRWSIFDKLFSIVKIMLRTGFLYLRYGFKDTMPFIFTSAKIKEKFILIGYLVRQRFTGRLEPYVKLPESQSHESK